MNDEDFDWIEERRPSLWPVLAVAIIVCWGAIVAGGLAWAVSWLAGRVW